MSTRAIVMMTSGVFLLAFSVLGLVESVHHSAHIFYSVLIVVSLGLAARGFLARRTDA